MPPPSPLVGRLQAILGQGGLLHSPAETLVYECDGYTVEKGRPDVVAFPTSTEQVVEVAFDGVQTSSRYPGGLALRFARVLRYRDDKGPDQADTIDTVRALHQG